MDGWDGMGWDGQQAWKIEGQTQRLTVSAIQTNLSRGTMSERAQIPIRRLTSMTLNQHLPGYMEEIGDAQHLQVLISTSVTSV